jgi:adenine-specific DNA-methyltransferase
MDEVFGEDNYQNTIYFQTTGGLATSGLTRIGDYVLWYSKNAGARKRRPLFINKAGADEDGSAYKSIETDIGVRRRLSTEELANVPTSLPKGRIFRISDLCGQGATSEPTPFEFEGREYNPTKSSHWKPNYPARMRRASRAGRIYGTTNTLNYVRFFDDYPVSPLNDVWQDTGHSGFAYDKLYIVQTATAVVQRCLLMATDPGDLVLDPTCGSGTTATVAEQWGRRWITIDTSRVALALARARIMGARYPFYLLADSREGREKEWLVARGLVASEKSPEPLAPCHNNIQHGFVYERVPHITLKSIANNAEIDVIWEKWQAVLEPLREKLNAALKQKWQEWEIPRDWASVVQTFQSASLKQGRLESLPHIEKLHADWWQARIARQKEIDASIAAKAEFEYLYDKPYEDKKKVRVAGPFTVESLSPHRVLGVDEDDELIDTLKEDAAAYGAKQTFPQLVLENLKTAGVQQAHKADRIVFESLAPWPGEGMICAVGTFEASGESDQWLVTSGQKESSQPTSHKSQTTTRKAGIFIGPEFGTVQRADLAAAAREAGDAGFDVLIACAFNYEAHATEFSKLGRIPVLKARMNADLHMAEDLKNTGKGNLFVIFGEPDIEVTCGLWLVARGGRKVANYEHVKELSGLGSLEEINRLGGADLLGFKKLSARRALRSDKPGAAGSGFGAVEHRGGSSPDGDGGVPAKSQRGERVAGGAGDAGDYREPSGNAAPSREAGTAGAGGRDRQDAGWAQALAGIETLTTADFPLSLTTSHYAQITVRGVDVFKPQTGEVVSCNADGIACWLLDTDYNKESFFVHHAYFLGQNDPYTALKTTLKAEINAEAWATVNSDTSRPFEKPKSGRIAVKVINHLGDEVMKVFKV